MRERKITIQKGTWVFLILLAIAGAGVLFWSLRPGPKPEVSRVLVFGGWQYGREDQKTAAKVLAKAGLADYRWDNGCLSVPQFEKGMYETALAAGEAFPKAPSDVKRESIRDMGPFESTAKTQLRDLNSSAWQLEQTIEQFSTKVGYATVGVRSRREQSGMIPKTIVTASVGVWSKEEEPLTPELLSAITLATKHQLGIEDDANISILDLRQGCSYLGTHAGVTEPGTVAESQRRQEEQYWQEKFTTALDYIPGIRVATVYRPVSLARQEPNTKTSATPEMKPEITSMAVLGNARLPRTVVTGYPSAPDNPSYAARFSSSGEVIPGEGISSEGTRGEGMGDNGCPLTVDIAIPISYVRRLIQGESARAGVALDDTSRQALERGDAVLEKVRREAAILMTPLLNGRAGEIPTNSSDYIHVSLFPDEEGFPPTGPTTGLTAPTTHPTKDNITTDNTTAGAATLPGTPISETTIPGTPTPNVKTPGENSNFWKMLPVHITGLWKSHRTILLPSCYGGGGLLVILILGLMIRRQRRNRLTHLRKQNKRVEENGPNEEELDRIEDHFESTGLTEIRKEIKDLVRNDPDQAARILQRWVHSG